MTQMDANFRGFLFQINSKEGKEKNPRKSASIRVIRVPIRITKRKNPRKSASICVIRVPILPKSDKKIVLILKNESIYATFARNNLKDCGFKSNLNNSVF
jgi:hypothetical protein